jgi:tetratricopeptide (TPR) repeat protein
MTRNLKIIALCAAIAAAGLAFAYSLVDRSLRAEDERLDWPLLMRKAQAGGFPRAMALVDGRLKAQPNDALMRYFKARLYYEHGDARPALEEADRAIALGYAQEISHLLKALVYGRLLGDYARQKELAAKALAFDPTYDEGYVVKAEAEYALGEYAACSGDAVSFSNMKPAETDGYEYLLLCRQGLRDYAGAEAAGRKILKMRPGSHSTYWRLGRVYAEQGLHKKAIKNFSEAIRLNGNRPQYYLDRAKSCEAEGDFSCAAWDYYSATGWKEVSSYASYYYLLGADMHRVGEFKPGLDAAEAAVRLQPGAAAGYELRGRLRADSGDLAGAKADFLKMAALDPALSAESARLISLLRKKRAADKL